MAPSHLIEHWRGLFKQYLGPQAFHGYRLVVWHEKSRPTATAIYAFVASVLLVACCGAFGCWCVVRVGLWLGQRADLVVGEG